MNAPVLSLDLLALRASLEIHSGEVVNLGYGLPSLLADYLASRPDIWMHTENGVVGIGRVLDSADADDPDVVNATGQRSSVRPGASFVDSALSFTIVRGGRLTTAVLGALQISEGGDLASWMVPERGYGGIGGAMDLCIGAKRVVAVIQHVTRDGTPKILERCTFPLTARQCVTTIVSDIAVIDVRDGRLWLREFALGWSPAAVQAVTAATLHIDEAAPMIFHDVSTE